MSGSALFCCCGQWRAAALLLGDIANPTVLLLREVLLRQVILFFCISTAVLFIVCTAAVVWCVSGVVHLAGKLCVVLVVLVSIDRPHQSLDLFSLRFWVLASTCPGRGSPRVLYYRLSLSNAADGRTVFI